MGTGCRSLRERRRFTWFLLDCRGVDDEDMGFGFDGFRVV